MTHTTETLTCLACPVGCKLAIDLDEAAEITAIRQNRCPRGPVFARQERIDPQRIITTTVAIRNARHQRLPVRLDGEVSRSDMMRLLKEIHRFVAQAPVKAGDVLLENVGGTPRQLVASRSLEKIEKR